eukprot:CFRG5545T1
MEFSGLAKEIRVCQGIEQFDLGGYNQAKLDKLIQDCFSTPIRYQGCCVTFLIGGGKATRQKYDPLMQKYITSSLIGVGYVEDRGASKETPGTFKHQHDTAKNLIFMHVFPHGERDADQVDGDEDCSDDEDDPLSKDPSDIVQILPLKDFEMFCAKKARSYTSKLRCLEHIKEAIARNEGIEMKMANRESVAADQQELYDNCVELGDKMKWLQHALQKHIEQGGNDGVAKLTGVERDSVVRGLESKIELMKKKLSEATDEKKKEKIQSILSSTVALHKNLSTMEVSTGLPLSHNDRLKKAYHKLRELEKIESKQAQTIEEMRRLRDEMPAVKEEIESLEIMSQEVFETEAELANRIRTLKATLVAKKKKGTSPASYTTSSSQFGSAGNAGWSTQGKKGGGGAKKVSGKGATGSNAFAALSLG